MRGRWPWARRRGGHDMTCREAVGLVTAYLDDVLTPREKERLERHLAECPHCREHLRQIETTIRVMGQVRDDDLDPAVREDLIDLFRRWRDDGVD